MHLLSDRVVAAVQLQKLNSCSTGTLLLLFLPIFHVQGCVGVYMFLKCLHLTVLHRLLNPLSKVNWIKWLRVCFCVLWLHRVLPWQWCGATQPHKGWVCSSRDKQSLIFHPDLSCGASGDHSLPAARSGRTCHLASSLQDQTLFPRTTAPLYEDFRRPCHLNMTGGLVIVYGVTVPPSALRLSLEPGAPQTILPTMRDQVSAALLLPLFGHRSHLLNEFMRLGKKNKHNSKLFNDQWCILQ